ncbi:DUF2231 domain-containing protein [Paracoccus nototheniae]|uniref:DUF2231 domain-containing protein n=1 Tax=Paracoccus nototheniae TaxID=2489002 RepID=A0ABW4DWG5_9RHOB|nr:DUF2231 domain-containing protein [Paracoccus nototheniae]
MAVTPTLSGARTDRRPLPGLATLTHISAGFLALTLVTDLAYMQTMVLMWQDFSSWLLFFGLIVGGVAALLWILSAVMGRMRPVWGAALFSVLALVAGFVNSLIHAGDGWTAIVPWGLALSAVTCVLMLCAALLSRAASRPRPFAVA